MNRAQPNARPAAPGVDPDAGVVDPRGGASRMVAGGLLLGTMGLFVVESGADPLVAVWSRCAFGALALTAWIVAFDRAALHWPGTRGALAASLGALAMLASWGLFFAAIGRTSIGVATVVFHVQPLWLMAVGAIWLGEPVRRAQWVAAGVGLIGIALAGGVIDAALVAMPRGPIDGTLGASSDSASHGNGGTAVVGIALALGAALSHTVSTLAVRHARPVGPLALAWWQCTLGTVAFAGVPLLHGLPSTAGAWGWLAGLGLLHTGVAYVLLYGGMARLPAARVAMLQFVYPAAALAVDAAVYRPAMSPAQWLGVALLLGALLAARGTAAAARGVRPIAAREPT